MNSEAMTNETQTFDVDGKIKFAPYPGWPGVCTSPDWQECPDCAGQGGLYCYCETCHCQGYVPVSDVKPQEAQP